MYFSSLSEILDIEISFFKSFTLSPSSFCFVFSSYHYTDKAFVRYLRIIRDHAKKSTMYKQN